MRDPLTDRCAGWSATTRVKMEFYVGDWCNECWGRPGATLPRYWPGRKALMVVCRPMAFALLVVYLVLTFVRPGEQTASLAPWRLMEIGSGLALGTAGFSVLAGRGPTFRAVQIPLMFAFWAWTLLSVMASPERSATALDQVLGFAKGSGAAFLLMILNVDTTRRLRIVAALLAVLALFVVGQGILAYHLDVGGAQFLVWSAGADGSESAELPLESVEAGESPETTGRVARIRGLGFIHDPNDLAGTLVAILPLLVALRRRGASVQNVLLVWMPAGIIVYGLYLTRSRGGILAFVIMLGLALRNRLGRALSILAGAGGLVVLLALGFLGGRSLSIDASATGRIEAWSEGLQMLRSSPVWGVGFGMFTQYNEKVAHNSFVHCFAELGLVGYFLWLSLIMLTLDDLRSVIRSESEDGAELRRWVQALSLSLLGFLAGGLLLSRSYDVMLFILLGLSVAAVDLARRRGHLPRSRNALVWTYRIVTLEIASIVVFWLYMRIVR